MTMSSATHNDAVVMGTTEARTPQRNTSSLAHDPISTPIASAKRPRASSSRMLLATPEQSASALSIESPSPMHTVKPVHREAIEEEIKDIFSPVAHFLHEAESEDESIAQPAIADEDEFNPWTFIQTLPPYESLQPNPVTLPPSSVNKKSLVLDLDETLVHCSVEAPDSPADLTFPVAFHGNNYTVHVKLRPYLQEFLESVSADFEVIVFTASQKVYADALLDLIDPGMFRDCFLWKYSLINIQRENLFITDCFERVVYRSMGTFLRT